MKKRNIELGTFLRTRRSQVSPEEAGLPPHARRRVVGLRREEVAQQAGVSLDYYARLEQGRQPTASSSILNALSRVLRLDGDERAHLFTLAGHSTPAGAGRPWEPHARARQLV